MLKNSTLINHIDIINLTLFFLRSLNMYSDLKIKRYIFVQLLKRCILKIFDDKKVYFKTYIAKKVYLKINMVNVFPDINGIKL